MIISVADRLSPGRGGLIDRNARNGKPERALALAIPGLWTADHRRQYSLSVDSLAQPSSGFSSLGFAEAGQLSLAYEIGIRIVGAIGSALDVILFQIAVLAEKTDGPRAHGRRFRATWAWSSRSSRPRCWLLADPAKFRAIVRAAEFSRTLRLLFHAHGARPDGFRVDQLRDQPGLSDLAPSGPAYDRRACRHARQSSCSGPAFAKDRRHELCARANRFRVSPAWRRSWRC